MSLDRHDARVHRSSGGGRALAGVAFAGLCAAGCLVARAVAAVVGGAAVTEAAGWAIGAGVALLAAAATYTIWRARRRRARRAHWSR